MKMRRMEKEKENLKCECHAWKIHERKEIRRERQHGKRHNDITKIKERGRGRI